MKNRDVWTTAINKQSNKKQELHKKNRICEWIFFFVFWHWFSHTWHSFWEQKTPEERSDRCRSSASQEGQIMWGIKHVFAVKRESPKPANGSVLECIIVPFIRLRLWNKRAPERCHFAAEGKMGPDALWAFLKCRDNTARPFLHRLALIRSENPALLSQSHFMKLNVPLTFHQSDLKWFGPSLPPIPVFAEPQRCDHHPSRRNNAEHKRGISSATAASHAPPSLPPHPTPSVSSDWLRYLQTCERRPRNLRNHSRLGASKFLVDLSALSSRFKRNQITHNRFPAPEWQCHSPSPPTLSPPGTSKLRGKSGVKEAASCLPPRASCRVSTHLFLQEPLRQIKKIAGVCSPSLPPPTNFPLPPTQELRKIWKSMKREATREFTGGRKVRLQVRCDRGEMRRCKATLMRNTFLNMKK